MLRNITYIGILVLLMACKTQKEAINKPVIEDLKKVFPEKEISVNIQNQISFINDSSLTSVYSKNSFLPIWKSDSIIKKGINWINDSKYDGLNPEKFNLFKLNELYDNTFADSGINTNYYAKLDLLLTKSIKECGYRIRYSILNPKEFHSGWNYGAPKKLPHDSIWINYIKNENINQLNAFFEPKNPEYSKLKKELKDIYAKTNQNIHLEVLDPGFLLQKGDSNQYVIPLKRKLLKIPNDSTVSMKFDEQLSTTVKKFQIKHGLYPDGIVGKQTYHFLNWNTHLYINILTSNLERLRWFNDKQFINGVTINIASQKLKYSLENKSIYNSKVIVGKYKNQTQVFQSSINYLVFNPCWTVPKSIANTQILYGAKRDSLYLQKRNMFICKNGLEIPTDSIDYSQYTASYFPFTIFQRTSESNALGRVKFMFKNHFSIYLHDTPQKSLFSKPIRTYSHGCIRLENALDFSDFILNKIDQQNIVKEKYLNKGYPVKVYLKQDIPINIIYLTCWFDDESGEVIYGKDVYLKDHILFNHLNNIK